jgi:hypothetical protein
MIGCSHPARFVSGIKVSRHRCSANQLSHTPHTLELKWGALHTGRAPIFFRSALPYAKRRYVEDLTSPTDLLLRVRIASRPKQHADAAACIEIAELLSQDGMTSQPLHLSCRRPAARTPSTCPELSKMTRPGRGMTRSWLVGFFLGKAQDRRRLRRQISRPKCRRYCTSERAPARPCGLEAKLHLFHNELHLALDGSVHDFPSYGVESGEP